MSRKLRPDYISHLSICKSDTGPDVKSWTFYQHGPWQHDCPKYKDYTNKTVLERLVKRKFPRIEYFNKPKDNTWAQEYAVFKQSDKKVFSLDEFILEWMDCGFVYDQIKEMSDFIKKFAKEGILTLTKESVRSYYFDCGHGYELDFWFKQINSCKKVEVIL